MLRRTLQEWQSLPYGEGAEAIPEWAADRLAAVARACPLGGEGGARILQHGRRAIRAAQVVGVIAAKDCTLEILPKIDGLDQGGIRRNLVHMLAVALDLEIAPGLVTNLDWQRENLLDILIRLFADKLTREVHRGLSRRYVGCVEDLPALRGRLNIVRQFTTLAASPDRLACQYDELSPDIALNQIMKSAVTKLRPVARSLETQRRLAELSLAFADITDVQTDRLPWDRVLLDRTNARWRELRDLARLLLEGRFQSTSSGSGNGFALLFEMNTLFEEYVGRTLKRALAPLGLSVDLQGGRLYCLTETHPGTGSRFLTKPDIIVRRGSERLLIIDTKWKLLSRHVDDPKQGVSQGDVYQMMAYGRVYGCPKLMLLYPHHAGLVDLGGIMGNHRVTGSADELAIATIDLSDLRTTRTSLCALALAG